jgi:hypothetical protein
MEYNVAFRAALTSNTHMERVFNCQPKSIQSSEAGGQRELGARERGCLVSASMDLGSSNPGRVALDFLYRKRLHLQMGTSKTATGAKNRLQLLKDKIYISERFPGASQGFKSSRLPPRGDLPNFSLTNRRQAQGWIVVVLKAYRPHSLFLGRKRGERLVVIGAHRQKVPPVTSRDHIDGC